jgi:hypothetical protein
MKWQPAICTKPVRSGKAQPTDMQKVLLDNLPDVSAAPLADKLLRIIWVKEMA